MLTAPEEYPDTVQRVIYLRSLVVREWLDRSGACPVDISYYQWDDSAMTAHAQPLIDSVLAYSSRWRNISITAPMRYMSKIVDIQPNNLPTLESVSITSVLSTSWEGPEAIRPPLMEREIFKAPKLTKLELLWFKDDALKLPVNWAQLTHIALEGTGEEWDPEPSSLSIPHCLDLLSLCPHLVSARLDVGGMNHDPRWSVETSGRPIIRLPHLESLFIYERVSLSWFFGRLELPRLWNLTFNTSSFPVTTAKISILILLEQMGTQLTKFTTNSQKFTTEDFINCLELLPRLIHLVVALPSGSQHTWGTPRYGAVTSLNDATLARMTPSLPLDEVSEVVVPMLQYFEASAGIGFSDTALRAFVLNRQSQSKLATVPRIGRLRKISIEFPRVREIDIMPDLAEFIDDGLDITLLYADEPLRGPFSPSDGLPAVGISARDP